MWPKCLPTNETLYLERFINTTIRSTVEERKKLKPHADMVREAKQMEKAALKLLSNLRDFEEHYTDAWYENHKREADRLLNGLSDEDLNTARIAYSQYSCQFVLLGLGARMRALQTRGKKRKGIMGRVLKEEVERVFKSLGLPIGRSNDFVQALDYAISLSGIKASADSLVRSKKSLFDEIRERSMTEVS